MEAQFKINNMNYTKKDGDFYKIIFNSEILTFGKLEPETVLSTVHEVIFITEEEYNVLNSDR